MGVVTTLPRSRPLSRRDLQAMPDDGHRYELVDGSLIVTPAPSNRHQTAALTLAMLLHQACPESLKLLFAPFDVALSDHTVLQPDLLVGRREDFTERDLPAAPVLVIEILSSSTRSIDLTLKRARYEAAGCSSYWVVDPELPALTVWELRDGRYTEAAHVVGNESFTATQPYRVTICPAELIDPPAPERV